MWVWMLAVHWRRASPSCPFCALFVGDFATTCDARSQRDLHSSHIAGPAPGVGPARDGLAQRRLHAHRERPPVPHNCGPRLAAPRAPRGAARGAFTRARHDLGRQLTHTSRAARCRRSTVFCAASTPSSRARRRRRRPTRAATRRATPRCTRATRATARASGASASRASTSSRRPSAARRARRTPRPAASPAPSTHPGGPIDRR